MLDLDTKYFRGIAPPEVVPEDLENIAKLGYVTVGVLAALTRFDSPDEYHVLMLHHRGRKKNLEGQLGPLAETMRVIEGGGAILRVEQPMSALERGMREELGVLPSEPFMYTGYFFSEWPVQGEVAFAICPVFVMDDCSWVPNFPQTEEITETRFLSPGEILRRPETWLRKGSKRFIEETQEFLASPLERAGLMSFVPPIVTINRDPWVDIHLGLASVNV